MHVKTKVKTRQWNEFIKKNDSALIYHTPEWQKFLEETFGYKPYYLFLIDECDQIVGLLPLMLVKSRFFGSRLSCLPFAHVCGYLGDKKLKHVLVERAIEIYNNLSNVNYLEIKDKIINKNFNSINVFLIHILELSPNVEEVWRKLDKGSVRWAIKKSQKSGVSVIVTKDINDLRVFYELNCTSKKEKGVPCHPWKFIRNLFIFLGKYTSLYAAKYEGELIAGGIMIFFKDRVIYGYGASNPNYLKLYPYNAFIWKAIEDACLKGYKYFDFGRSSYSNRGLINFKKRWGTIEHKLYYSYYPANTTPSLINAQNSKSIHYKVAKGIIRYMPMVVYKKFSKFIFGGLG